jgi:hypothetical protein
VLEQDSSPPIEYESPEYVILLLHGAPSLQIQKNSEDFGSFFRTMKCLTGIASKHDGTKFAAEWHHAML